MISHSSPSTQEFCRVSFCGIKCFCSNIYHFVGEFISFLIWILDDLPTKHFCSVDVSYVSADRCVVIYFKELHFDIASPWLPTPLRWNYFIAICCWFISFHIGRPAADNRPQRCCLCDVLGHSLQEWQLDHTLHDKPVNQLLFCGKPWKKNAWLRSTNLQYWISILPLSSQEFNPFM